MFHLLQKIDYLFRETLFSQESMKDCIGGVILYDETIKQSVTSGKKNI